MDKLLSVLIIIVVFAIIVTIIFNVYDSNTGYSTMDTGVVIDKERALRDDHRVFRRWKPLALAMGRKAAALYKNNILCYSNNVLFDN